MSNKTEFQPPVKRIGFWSATKSAWRARFGRETDLVANDMHEYAKREVDNGRIGMALYFAQEEIASLKRRLKKCGDGEKPDVSKRLCQAYCNAAALCLKSDTSQKIAESGKYCLLALSVIEAAYNYPEKRELQSLLNETVAKCCYLTGNTELGEKHILRALDIPFPKGESLAEVRRLACLNYLAAELCLENDKESKAVEHYNMAIVLLSKHEHEHMFFLRETLLWHILCHSQSAIQGISSYNERYFKKWDDYLAGQKKYERAIMPSEPWMEGYQNKETKEYTYSTPNFCSPWKQGPDSSKEKVQLLNQFPPIEKW